MKRTNLVLNEKNLEDVTRLLGAKTYSEAVNMALEQTIKLYHIRQLAELTGTNIWEGNLNEMREDKSTVKKKNLKKSKK